MVRQKEVLVTEIMTSVDQQMTVRPYDNCGWLVIAGMVPEFDDRIVVLLRDLHRLWVFAILRRILLVATESRAKCHPRSFGGLA